MIKFALPEKPQQLALNEQSLTNEFKADNTKAVWKKQYITDSLLEMTHNKCAYSEVRLNENSNYMEVEHFKNKDKYPDDVVKWGNLLPSCKKCNAKKGSWDVVAKPIVHPIYDNPKDFLYVKVCRFYSKGPKGQNTIDAVALNDFNHFVIPRFRITNAIIDSISYTFRHLKSAQTKNDALLEIDRLKRILRDCNNTTEYSAVVATSILSDWELNIDNQTYNYSYDTLKKYLIANKFWDVDFEDIENMLSSIALPKP